MVLMSTVSEWFMFSFMSAELTRGRFAIRAAHRRHIAARAEPSPLARQHDCADVRVLAAAPQMLDRPHDHRLGERVQLPGTVEGKRRHPIGELELEVIAVGRHEHPPLDWPGTIARWPAGWNAATRGGTVDGVATRPYPPWANGFRARSRSWSGQVRPRATRSA